jgi:hypothetical protein
MFSQSSEFCAISLILRADLTEFALDMKHPSALSSWVPCMGFQHSQIAFLITRCQGFAADQTNRMFSVPRPNSTIFFHYLLSKKWQS